MRFPFPALKRRRCVSSSNVDVEAAIAGDSPPLEVPADDHLRRRDLKLELQVSFSTSFIYSFLKAYGVSSTQRKMSLLERLVSRIPSCLKATDSLNTVIIINA